MIGTRGSRLAHRQTEIVVSRLSRVRPGLVMHTRPIRTTADRQPQTELQHLPGVGFFVKELELALLAEEISAAVHSMKDLPTIATDGLMIAAVTEREDPRDVLIARDGWTLDTLPASATVGTSSPRRAASLKALRADLTIVPIRGNVETRIRKVDAGEVDAVCLAAAGLARLGLLSRVTQWLPIDVILPAPGQGALGVQVRAGDAVAADIVSAVDHPATHYAVDAERAVLRTLGAGCQLPVGAYAEVTGERLTLRASVASPDGRHIISGERTGTTAEREALGADLADELLARGATDLGAGIHAGGKAP